MLPAQQGGLGFKKDTIFKKCQIKEALLQGFFYLVAVNLDSIQNMYSGFPQ